MTATAATSRRTLLTAAMGATALGATLGPASASAGVDLPSDPQVEYYLDLPPIRGESVTRGYENQIPVLDWSLGVDNTASRLSGGTGGARAGKPVPRPFTAVARSSIASPPLFGATAAGTRSPRARLFGVRQSAEDAFEFLLVTLENVAVISYSMTPDSVNAQPLDLFELDYARLTIRWSQMDSEGGIRRLVTNGFDFLTNRPT